MMTNFNLLPRLLLQVKKNQNNTNKKEKEKTKKRKQLLSMKLFCNSGRFGEKNCFMFYLK